MPDQDQPQVPQSDRQDRDVEEAQRALKGALSDVSPDAGLLASAQAAGGTSPKTQQTGTDTASQAPAAQTANDGD
jgi:hypothetical protein